MLLGVMLLMKLPWLLSFLNSGLLVSGVTLLKLRLDSGLSLLPKDALLKLRWLLSCLNSGLLLLPKEALLKLPWLPSRLKSVKLPWLPSRLIIGLREKLPSRLCSVGETLRSCSRSGSI